MIRLSLLLCLSKKKIPSFKLRGSFVLLVTQKQTNMKHMKNINTLAASVLAGGMMFSGSADAALVSYFSFDGDATNGIGGQADGVVTGSATYAAGKFGQAVGLDAINDSVDLASTSLGAIGTGNFTISLWVSLNGQTVSGDPAFFANKSWASGTNVGINYAVKGGGNLDVNTYGSARVDFQDGDTSDLSASSWDNIILVRDGETLKYYFNGVQEAGDKAIAAGVTFESANTFKLGDDGLATYNNAGNAWTGDMLFDDLAIYDTALDASAITALQSTAAVPEPSSAALLGLGGLSLILRRRR